MAKRTRHLEWLLPLLLIVWIGYGAGTDLRALPDGVSFAGAPRPVHEIAFLADLSWQDGQGKRHLSQQIFDQAFELIERAESFLVLDIFLFNDAQGPTPEQHRKLSSELTHALIRKRETNPSMPILLITDPINTVYGGSRSPQLESLEDAGIHVVLTDLDALRDSNRLWSFWWRALFKHLGNTPADTVKSPFGNGKTSLRSYLALLNFKANHRKVIVASVNNHIETLLMSANAHDASSAHGNIALKFSGEASVDAFTGVFVVARFSAQALSEDKAQIILTTIKEIEKSVAQIRHTLAPIGAHARKDSLKTEDTTTIRLSGEGKTRQALLESIESSSEHDQLNIAVFYLSDRKLIKALQAAASRGVKIRVLLDPNKDAFGHEKNGIPNRPVAKSLHSAGIARIAHQEDNSIQNLLICTMAVFMFCRSSAVVYLTSRISGV